MNATSTPEKDDGFKGNMKRKIEAWDEKGYR